MSGAAKKPFLKHYVIHYTYCTKPTLRPTLVNILVNISKICKNVGVMLPFVFVMTFQRKASIRQKKIVIVLQKQITCYYYEGKIHFANYQNYYQQTNHL